MKKKSKSEAQVNALTPLGAKDALHRGEEQVKALVPASRAVPAVIKSDDDLDVVGHFLRQIATTKKNVLTEERSVTGLLDKAKKGIRLWFKPMHDKLDELRGENDDKIFAYNTLVEERAQQAREKEIKREEKRLAILERNRQKKLEEARSKAEAEAIREEYAEKDRAVVEESNAALNEIVEEKPSTAGVSIVKRWKVEVVDWAEVPDEYLKVSLLESKALDTCREQVAAGREPSIRGLRFFQDTSTAARSFN